MCDEYNILIVDHEFSFVSGHKTRLPSSSLSYAFLAINEKALPVSFLCRASVLAVKQDQTAEPQAVKELNPGPSSIIRFEAKLLLESGAVSLLQFARR